MNEEIPYAIYVKNESNENESKQSPELIESNESIELPVSIEIVPHKAILIRDATIDGNNYIPIHSKYCLCLCCTILFMISIMFLLSFLTPNVKRDNVAYDD